MTRPFHEVPPTVLPLVPPAERRLALVMRQAAIVTHDNFPRDMDGLERDISRIVERPRSWLVIGSVAGLVAVALWVGISQFGRYEVGRTADTPITDKSAATLLPNAPIGHVWEACETHTGEICGTWTRQGDSNSWIARWANGAVAALNMTVNGQLVTIQRNDAQGVSPGLRATYTGTLNKVGHIENGIVEWCCDGLVTRRGTWKANITR